MKKVALLFVMAVLLPSLALGWLALRSLRDQRFLVERQQAASWQGLAGALAQKVNGILLDQGRDFSRQVDDLLADKNFHDLTGVFDTRLRQKWSMAEVGFVVSLDGGGRVLSPSLFSDAAARTFRLENDRFLCNKEAVDIYWNPKAASLEELDASLREVGKVKNPYPDKSGKMGAREKESKASNPTEAEFRQVVADGKEGSIARFLQNQLKVLFWYRPSTDPNLVFGAQLNLARLVQHLQSAFELDPGLTNAVTVALLDDSDHPRLKSNPFFRGDWKHPFVVSDVGQVLPHWQVGVFLNYPETLAKSANTVRWTVGLLVALLLVAIAAGSWLIAADLRRQLALSRQKTDFVSNVSHELKTPLTSIRMFSELLAEGRVSDLGKQRSYLAIITAEAARLTRLINNVLDFARIERGEKKYNFQRCDLVQLVRETCETF